LTPATTDRALAVEWLRRFTGNGVDGVVAKHRGLTYQPGKRAMLKVKVERTADCVVGGFRDFPDGAVASLLLGLYDDTGMLRHVGVCAAFAERERWKLAEMMRPLVRTLEGHPWQRGFGLERSPVGRLQGAAGRWDPTMELDWTPIALLVAEVAYDTLDDQRLRHPARFRRWRPDRDPASCTFDQLPDEAPNLQMLLSAVVAES
jgi:ATP-dependent DNA ligase